MRTGWTPGLGFLVALGGPGSFLLIDRLGTGDLGLRHGDGGSGGEK